MSYIICSDLEKNEMNLPPEWNVSLEFCDCCCPHSCSRLLPTPQQNMCCAKQTSTRESENLSVSKRLVQNKWATARGAVGWVGSRDAQKQPQVGLKFLKKPCLPPPARLGAAASKGGVEESWHFCCDRFCSPHLLHLQDAIYMHERKSICI